MVGIVPQPDRGLGRAVLVTQCAQARRAQHERSAVNWLNPDPACGQHSEKMSAGKKQNISSHRAPAAHDAISPRSDLLRRFAARAAVAEQLPVRTFSQDVNREAAFVLAIIPFDQVSASFSYGSEPGQRTCPHGALQGAGEHFRKLESAQAFSQPSRIALPAVSERQISKTGVLTGDCPSRFAVSGQVDDREAVAHVLLLMVFQVLVISGLAISLTSGSTTTFPLALHT